MCRETFLENIPVDGLSRCGPLSGGDDHLAVRGRYATGGIQAGDARPHVLINEYLAGLIHPCSERLGKVVIDHIAAGGKERLDEYLRGIVENETANLRSASPDVLDW
jgi:hypothetical protein